MDFIFLQELGYIVAATLFIFGLKMLSKEDTAARGNLVSSIGMLIAVLVTLIKVIDPYLILLAMIIGAGIGSLFALKVKMTSIPEMVALFNGFGGLSSFFLAWSQFINQSNVSFILILILSFSLNSNNQISQKDIEDELRITKSDLIEFYSIRSEELLLINDISFPVTIRFKSNVENFINMYDDFSGKEFFIFEDSMSNQSNAFTEQWIGEEKSFLIANTVDYELILFSDNSYQDFSNNIIK